MRWGEIETCKFVKIYLSHEYLWNSDHENYKLKDKRQMAYQTIIDEFMSSTGIRLSESQVRIKIKNLRSTYIQEIAKIRSRSIPNLPYTSTIKWFLDWHKCFKNRSKKSLTDSVYDKRILDDEIYNNKPWIKDAMDENNERNLDLFKIQSLNNNYDLIVKCDLVETSLTETERPHPYEENEKKLMLQSPAIESTFSNNLDSNLESISKEDEFDIYGKYIASQLRRMNLKKALRLQLEIASLVCKARIGD